MIRAVVELLQQWETFFYEDGLVHQSCLQSWTLTGCSIIKCLNVFLIVFPLRSVALLVRTLIVAAGLQGNLGSKQFPWSELLELDTIVISLTRCYQASI